MKTNVGPNKQHLLQGSPVDWLRIYRICIPVQQHPLPNFVLPFIPQIMIPSKHLALQTCLTVRFWTTQSMTQNPIIPLSFISFLFPSLSFTSFPEQSSPNFSRGSQQGIIYTGWGGAKRNTLAQNKFWRSIWDCFECVLWDERGEEGYLLSSLYVCNSVFSPVLWADVICITIVKI